MKKTSLSQRLNEIEKTLEKTNITEKDKLVNCDIARAIINIDLCEEKIKIPNSLIQFIP